MKTDEVLDAIKTGIEAGGRRILDLRGLLGTRDGEYVLVPIGVKGSALLIAKGDDLVADEVKEEEKIPDAPAEQAEAAISPALPLDGLVVNDIDVVADAPPPEE
jgi:hypothetical protein